MLRNTDFLMKKQGFNSPQAHRQDRGQDRVLAPARLTAIQNGQDNERGSAIIWILIMVALFAALNYAVSRGSRSGGATISKEQAAVAATEIIDYARLVKQTVQTLQINGCSDTEISFENTKVAGYTNPNAPSDNSCHIFDLAGGGINYLIPKDDWMDGLATSEASGHYETWYTTAQNWITGLGTDDVASACTGGGGDNNCYELITGVPFIKKDVCVAINKKLGWGTDDTGTPYQDDGFSYANSTTEFFTGTYDVTVSTNMGLATPSNYSNIMTGCIEGDSTPPSGTYSFFQVLIAR